MLFLLSPYFHQETNGETQLRTKSLETACRANRSEPMKTAAPPYDNGHGSHPLQDNKKNILNISIINSNKALPSQLQEPVQCRPTVRSELRYSCHIEPYSFLIDESNIKVIKFNMVSVQRRTNYQISMQTGHGRHPILLDFVDVYQN